MKNHYSAVVVLASVLVFADAASAAAAAVTGEQRAADAESTDLAEIVVTAQRRSEDLQKAALTIEVLDGKAISNAGVTVPSDLTSVLPTVQIGTSGPATAVYVRGVGGFASTVSTSPAVPYYIDGVYVDRTQSVASEFYDVQRLELIKGPQGTLYGRNASGGAINVLTRDPVLGQLEGQGEAEFGNYRDFSGEGGVNIPLGDTFALRASGSVAQKGGYTSTGLGDDKHEAGRLKLLWKPNEDLSTLLNGSFGHIGGLGSAVVPLNRGIAGWYPWLDISDPRTQNYTRETAVVPVPGFVRPSEPSDTGQNLRFYNFSAQVNWNFGPATLTVIPAYRHADMRYDTLVGFRVANGADVGDIPNHPVTSIAKSLEVRLAGEASALKWVLGLYSDNEDQFEQYTVNGGFLQSVGIIDAVQARSNAIFGQTTFSVVEHFRLIGGLRYTSDRRELLDGQSYIISPAAFLGPPAPQAAPCALPAPTQPECLVDSYAGRKTFSNVSWKAGFEADVLNDSLLYATASRGFKAGGFNTQSSLNAPGQAQEFSPEILTAYEAGLKSRYLNNKLQVNVSGFYWNYQDHQEPVLTFTNVPGVTNLEFLNAGAAKIYGVDLDIVARPWAGGTISSAVEYDHSHYSEFTKNIPTFSYSPAATGCRVASQNPATTTLDCSGFQVSRSPQWAGGGGLTQDIALPTGKLTAGGNVTFATSRWIGTDFIPLERVPGYAKLDLLVSYHPPKDRWSVTAFVRNLNNAAIYTEGAKNPFSPLVYADIQPPRTYGARVAVSF